VCEELRLVESCLVENSKFNIVCVMEDGLRLFFVKPMSWRRRPGNVCIVRELVRIHEGTEQSRIIGANDVIICLRYDVVRPNMN
jgi:hypothetical protein